MSEPTVAAPKDSSDAEMPTPDRAERPGMSTSAGAVLKNFRGFGGALAALLIMVVYLSVTQEFFFTKANILNVLSGNSALMITAIGLTFVVLSAGFDLSVGAIYAAAGYVAYRALESGLPEVIALVLGGLTGILLGGAVNGVLIGRIRLNFFVVTLGTTSLFTGALNVVTNGKTNTIPIEEGSLLYALGNGTIMTIPVPVVLSLAVLVLSGYLLRFTSFGRAVYAVGGNPEAARLAGINVSWVYVCVYGLGGLFASVAGMVDASRLASASPTAGASLALTAGAAVLLGGTSFYGGLGGVFGTVVGVLLIAVLQNGLGLMGVSAFWQGVVTGTVLVVAVLLDKLQSRST
ncbi:MULTISPECIES: ABC transporter permease [Nocardiaceae]|uniref:ABC transporter permease n=2 Tax=Mycobacteriales TaxID=85007 RepID=UPI0009EC8D68|nr:MULTISPECIES: ABC transporter permease [Rhodococcus]MDP9635356.1 ribose transport system permease protein [Rhodococcus cercidiphylli]RZL72244.1 MAG: ABC transporter permease [Rhodococcus sp. (in: high G+C Gram-positive bacteria)]MBY4013210.1 ABC transporter permease [Rhodococcus fascians]MBY4024348.1 ABC transporter permease [Rhodococcus fascians]MDJ0408953.1 ABC transporter permease [Rhodococcus fascians]